MKIQGFTSLEALTARVAAALMVLMLLLASQPAMNAAAVQPMSLNTIGVGSQGATLTYGTAGSADFTITLTAKANPPDIANTTLSVSGLPTGATGTFSPNPVSCTGTSCEVTSTLTITTVSTTPAVAARPFTVIASGSSVTGTGFLTINKLALVVTAVSDSKTYDGGLTSTGVPQITSGSLRPGDTAVWSQTFSDKNVGTGKTLTPTGTISDNNGGANYSVDFTAVTTGEITTRSASVTPNAASKVYGTTDPAFTGTLSGFITADNVTATYSRTAGSNVGGYTISATLSPTGALPNYSITYNTASFTITARNLTISGVTVNPKIYDATTNATLNNGSAALVGVVDSDNVTLNSSGATGAFVDKSVGTGKAVNASGYTLGGTASGNYTLSQPTGVTGNITAASLTVTGVTANSRVYNATLTTTLSGTAVLSGTLASDNVTLGGTGVGNFGSKAVGTAKQVIVTGYSISGPDAGNYLLSQPTSLTADITVAPLTVTGVTPAARVYDGTAITTLAGTPSWSGLFGSDAVTLGGTPVATYGDRNVGTGKTATVSGYIISGLDSGNYSFSQPIGLTGNITAKALTITGLTANPKVYDALTSATLTGTAALSGIVSPDSVTLSGTGAATFADKAVGTAKPVTVTGYTIGGTDVGNYTLTQPTVLAANITPASLTVSGVAAVSKVYDRLPTTTLSGTAALSTVLGSDSVTLGGTGIGNFADKAVGTAKPVTVTGYSISGPDAGNYTLSQPTGLTADITAAPLTVTGISVTAKIYDGTTVATLSGTAALSGVIAGDTVTPGGTPLATFVDVPAGTGKNVGTAKPVTVTGYVPTGTDAPNYALTQPTGLTGNITAKPLTVSGVSVAAKVYDGTTAATLTGTAALTGVVIPDVVTLGGTPLATFVDVPAGTGKNVGTAKAVTVTGYNITGTDVGNYTLAQPTGLTANITPKALTITSGVAVINKIYNGNTTATFNITTPVFGGLVSGDVVTLNSAAATGTFVDIPAGTGKNVGTAKAVTAAGFALAGTGAPNYTLTQPTGLTANITVLVLAPTTTASSRTYNGTRTATAVPAIAKAVPTDIVTVGYTSALFDTKDVGNGKPVTVTGISLTGTDAPNYSLSTTTAVTMANITKAPLTIKANDASKVVGDVLIFTGDEYTTTPATLYSSQDWINGVTLTSTGAGAEAAVGTYPIVAKDAYGNGLSNNYNIHYSDGLLTVNPPLPAFLATPASRNYGLVKVAMTSSSVFTIQNTGGSDLVFSTVGLGGSYPGQFLLGSNTCAGATLAPDETCSVTISFKPTTAGAKSALLQFSDNTSAGTHAIALSGKGAVELALNGGFNAYPTATIKIPTKWTASGFAATDGKSTTVKQEGVASVRIGNTSARAKTLTQMRNISGLAGNTLQLSVWARGQAIPTSAGLVRLQVQLYNGTTLVQTKLISLPTGTYAFTQKRTAVFTASKPYNKVVITLTYSKPTGAVWFDGVSLLRAP